MLRKMIPTEFFQQILYFHKLSCVFLHLKYLLSLDNKCMFYTCIALKQNFHQNFIKLIENLITLLNITLSIFIPEMNIIISNSLR